MSAVLELPSNRLRLMNRDDLPAVLDIESRAYPFPWGKEIFLDCLRVGYSCWVYEGDGAICAYGILSTAAGECHVLNLCVDPEVQRRGIGRSLLRQLLSIARQLEVDTVFLEARPSNAAAVQLYQSVGFNEIGRRKSYYPTAGHRREDAVVFAKTL